MVQNLVTNLSPCLVITKFVTEFVTKFVTKLHCAHIWIFFVLVVQYLHSSFFEGSTQLKVPLFTRNLFFSPPLQRLITGIKPLRLLVGRFPTVGTSLLLTREPTKTAGVVNQPDSLYRDSRSSSCKEAEEEAATQPKQQEAPANQPALTS